MADLPERPEIGQPEPEGHPTGRMAGRMHDGSRESDDPVCPCEAEPYWLAAAGEEDTTPGDGEEACD